MSEENKKKLEIPPELLYLMQESVTEGVNRGIRIAVNDIQKIKENKKKVIYDTRLRNTKLLLKNYLNFKSHIDNTVYAETQLNTPETSDILDKLLEDDEQEENKQYEKTVVQSILKSKKRTEIIIEHIDNILELYKIKANKSNNIELQRRQQVINLLYEEGKDIFEVAELLSISVSTVKRDRNQATKELAILMFGIDGIIFD